MWKQYPSRAFEFFTPEGCFNSTATRPKKRLSRARCRTWSGSAWAKTRRLLLRRESFTFLDQAVQRLAGLGLDPEDLSALLDLEGLRRQPRRLGNDARVGRDPGLGVGPHGPIDEDATRLARSSTAGSPRVGRGVASSSLVECVNSVVRMQQWRHRKIDAGVCWTSSRLVLESSSGSAPAALNKNQTPYSLLGLKLPDLSFWEFLKLTPEELRKQLSAQGYAT